MTKTLEMVIGEITIGIGTRQEPLNDGSNRAVGVPYDLKLKHYGVGKNQIAELALAVRTFYAEKLSEKEIEKILLDHPVKIESAVTIAQSTHRLATAISSKVGEI
jgi:hypothetical protein